MTDGVDGPQDRPGDLALDVRTVSKTYGGLRALRHVSVSLSAGEVLGVIGPNGAGKTTLVSIIAGLIRPDEGSVRIDGHDVERAPQRCHAMLGLATQELAIYPSLRVERNLTAMGELYGLERVVARERADELCDALGLEALRSRTANTLSGGEKRRLHTAMALMHRPRVLLLDEPTAGVDVETRGKLLRFVAGLARGGTAVCYTSHYLTEVETLATRIGLLVDGRIAHYESASKFIAAHARGYVEVTFSQDAETIEMQHAVIHGRVVRIPSDDPIRTVTDLLRDMNGRSPAPVSIRAMQGDLQDAYERAVRDVRHNDHPTGADEG